MALRPKEPEKAKIKILSPREAERLNVLDDERRETHNFFLAWKYADRTTGKNSMSARGWFPNGDMRELKETLWIHWPLMRRVIRVCPPLSPVGEGSVERDTLVQRCRQALINARKVVPPTVLSEIAKQSVFADNNEDDEEREEDAAEEDIISGSAAYPSTFFFGWSKMHFKLDRSTARSRFTFFKYAGGAIAEASQSHDGEGAAQLIEEVERTWTHPGDALYAVARSSLLLNVQLANTYSYIGTQAHLRLAISMVSSGRERRDGRVQLDLYDPRRHVFAAAEGNLNLPDSPFFKLHNVWRVQEDVYDFCMGGNDSIYAKFTAPFASEPGQPPSAEVLERMFREMFREMEAPGGAGPAWGASVVSVEYPLINPWLMCKHKATSRRCYFSQTQADFVLHVQPPGEPGFVLLGDFKTVMEVSSPDVAKARNVQQVFANARIFEAMTGVRVRYGALVVATRRPEQTVYVIIMPLYTPDRAIERAHGPRVAEEKAAYDDLVRQSFFHALLDPFEGQDRRSIFADAGLVGVFDKGIAASVGKDTKAAWEALGEAFAFKLLREDGDDVLGRALEGEVPRASYTIDAQWAEAGRGRAEADDGPVVDADEDEPTEEEAAAAGPAVPAAAPLPGWGAKDLPASLISFDQSAKWVLARSKKQKSAAKTEYAIYLNPGEKQYGAVEALPRAEQVQARRPDAVGNPFIGLPVDLERRRQNRDESEAHAELRTQLSADVVARAEAAYDSLPRDVREELEDPHVSLDKLNSLFRHLKDFTLPGGAPELDPEPGWAAVTAPRGAAPGQFDDLLLRTRSGVVPVNRMGHLNRPADEYPPRTAPRADGGGPRDVDASDYHEVLKRTLHRLVNERVQRAYVVPDALTEAVNEAEPVHPEAAITRGDAVRRFLHLSQRPFWDERLLRYGAEVLDEEARRLEAQLALWVAAA